MDIYYTATKEKIKFFLRDICEWTLPFDELNGNNRLFVN